ncbi:MAG: hypothetical protein DMD35_11190 [Gemmatimonadetes bacterium]|nr:MAG: hypothetical protein DMD35_11190 [Gemmatimonadota bacterium]
MTYPPVAEATDLATLPQRIAAQFLDGLIAAVPFLVGVLITMLSNQPRIVFLVVSGILGMLYTLLSDGLEGGQSFGKRLVGIRVVSIETGAPCTFGQSFLRNLLLTILGPIDWIFIFGERRQRLGDKAAGTIVIVD